MYRSSALFFLFVAAGLPRPVQAQGAFRLGARLGLNVGASAWTRNQGPSLGRTVPGLDAGLAAAWTAGRWSLAPALLYSRKGYTTYDESYTPGGSFAGPVRAVFRNTVRLHYLALPLDLAYARRADGQGFRVFGGAYVACLLGGRVDSWSAGPRGSARSSSAVEVGAAVPLGSPATYARRLDYGAQAGVGFRYGPADVRIGYSLGLANVASEAPAGGRRSGNVEGGRAGNQTWQVAVGFWFGRYTGQQARHGT